MLLYNNMGYKLINIVIYFFFIEFMIPTVIHDLIF